MTAAALVPVFSPSTIPVDLPPEFQIRIDFEHIHKLMTTDERSVEDACRGLASQLRRQGYHLHARRDVLHKCYRVDCRLERPPEAPCLSE